jgi:hypothetical protein
MPKNPLTIASDVDKAMNLIEGKAGELVGTLAQPNREWLTPAKAAKLREQLRSIGNLLDTVDGYLPGDAVEAG